MPDAKSYILLAILVVFLIVLVQNAQVVTLRFLFWRMQISQVPLLLLVGVFGFAGGYVMRMIQVARKKRQGGQHGTSSTPSR